MTEMTQEQAHSHAEIHLPPPSAWPLVLGLGVFVLALGLVVRGGRVALPLDSLLNFLVQLNLISLKELPQKYQELTALIPQIGLYLAGAGGLILATAIGGWATSNIRERMAGPTFAGDSKMAMWVFLGNEMLFFTGLIAAFLLLRYQAASGVDQALVNSIPLVSLNTFVLLSSSLTVVLAHDAAVRGRKIPLIVFLGLTIILGTAFVSLQGVEYSRLYSEGLTWTSGGYGTAFFTLTGTHGLHVIIGIIWCLVVFLRALSGGFNEKHYGGVEIFGLYWHFVDIVWILLFTIVYLMHTAAPPAAEPAGYLLRGLGLG